MRISFSELAQRLGKRSNAVIHTLEITFGVPIQRLASKDGATHHKKRYLDLAEAVAILDTKLSSPEVHFTPQQYKYLDSWEDLLVELKDFLEELEEEERE